VKRVVLLDGGMGQELIRRTRREPTPLWSARVMHEEPELVRRVHLENIRAGARVITVNAYSVTRDRLEPNGLGEEFHRLQRLACDLARQARDEAGEDVTIAGCLPPLKWSYRWQDVDPVAVTEPIYREIAELQAPHVDLMLCETMASGLQAEGAVRGAQAAGLPAWVAWTVDDVGTGRLRSGETLAEANARLGGLRVDARLVNCSIPEAVTAALPALARLGGSWGAYANGFTGIPDAFGRGTTVKMLEARGDMGVEAYAEIALGWVRDGAAIIGGCCEITPAHIARLAERLTEAGYAIRGDLP
jgi:S-methylmethionine-dependent homocysteine/selenocysteine methylase